LHSIHEAVASVSPWNFEGRFIRPDGKNIWFQGISQPVKKGSVLVFTGVLLDITARKTAEESLRENELRFRTIFEKTHDAFLMFTDGSLTDCNQYALDLFGYSSRDEIIGTGPWDLSPEKQPDGQDSQEAAGPHIRAAMEQGSNTFEWTHARKDGSMFTADILLSAYELSGRQVIFTSIRDITGRKRMEEDLFSSRQMLQAVLDSIPQRVFWKDRNSVFLGCNKPLALDVGYADPREMVGKTDDDHASRANADLFRADDRQVMETGRPKINYEESQIRADGSTAWLRTSKVPLRSQDGAIIGVLGTYEDITGQKLAQEKLRESEERYRSLVESSFDGIAIHQDGIIVFVNSTAARLLGYQDPCLLTGKPALDIIHPEDQSWVAARIKMSPEKPLELMHEQFLRADGSYLQVDVATIPCIWQGRPAVYVTFRDISEQKKAQDALRESEEKYRSLVEKANEAITIIQDWRLIFVNNRMAELIGEPAENLVGRPFLDIVWPDDREDIKARHIKRCCGEKVPDMFDFGMLGPGGKKLWIYISIAEIQWQGRPATLNLMTDITERKVTEEALRESEQKFRHIIENMQDAYIRADEKGIITLVNPSAARMFGYRSVDEMTSVDAHTLYLRPGDRDELFRLLRDAGGITNFSGETVRRDGTTFPVSMNVQIIRDESGSMTGTEAIVRDMSEKPSRGQVT
jgi:PAS domain S-box-containing protein